jgi:multidrug transporter EmrE-like cation transporter
MSDAAASISEGNAASLLKARPRWLATLLNPYLQLGVGSFTATASELMLKVGATSAHPTGWLATLGVGAMASAWTWAGIACYLATFASWLYVLRTLPLGIAYGVSNVVQVLIPVASWLLLGETIPPRRLVGIVLVVGGLMLLVRQFARAEDKLG